MTAEEIVRSMVEAQGREFTAATELLSAQHTASTVPRDLKAAYGMAVIGRTRTLLECSAEADAWEEQYSKFF